MRQAAALLHDNEYAPDYDRVLELAAKSGATAYDCEFVELAERLGVVLVTNDMALRRAFPKLAVSMSDFVAGLSSTTIGRVPSCHPPDNAPLTCPCDLIMRRTNIQRKPALTPAPRRLTGDIAGIAPGDTWG